MKRRALQLLSVLLVMTVAATLGCGQKPGAEKRRIAFVYYGPDPAVDQTIDGFLEALKDSGLVEGRNLAVERRHASGEIANFAPIYDNLDAQGLDLIVPLTTPSLTAAVARVKRTRMVFVHTYAPFDAGVGASLDSHLPNLTGVASFPPIVETIDVITNLVPGIQRIGTIYNPAENNSVKAIRIARGVLSGSGVELVEITVTSTNEVMDAARALQSRGVQAFWITGDNTVMQAMEAVAQVALQVKAPLVINDPECVNRGALAGVGIGWRKVGRDAGAMAYAVLNGADPASMSIVNVSGRRVVVNRAVAERIGLAISEVIAQEAEPSN